MTIELLRPLPINVNISKCRHFLFCKHLPIYHQQYWIKRIDVSRATYYAIKYISNHYPQIISLIKIFVTYQSTVKD